MSKTDQLAIEQVHNGAQAVAGVLRPVNLEVAPMIRLAPHLRVISDQDGAIVLDIKRNAMFSLNCTTAYIWEKLAGGASVVKIVTQLSEETGESTEVVRSDILQFLDELRANRLIVERPSFRPMKHVALKAYLLLCLYDLLVPPLPVLRRGSLWFIHGFVKRLKVAPFPATAATSAAICDSIDKACSWYPKQVLCLQRSVVTTYLLRRAGVSAVFVIAAQKLPFKSHAWVEVAGHVVNDKPDVGTHFLVFDRC